MATTPSAPSRHAVVTGGGTGLGRAIAARLARACTSVHIVGRRVDRLEATAAAIDAELPSPVVTPVVADCADPADVEALATQLPDRIDVLVLNAGGTSPTTGDSLAATAADWSADFRRNVLTAVLPAHVLLPRLARPGGRIVVMSSVAALRGSGSYGAMKGALNTWATGLAAEVAADGITVNAVAPGFVPDTEFWDARRTDDLVERRSASIPVGRPGTPDEIAALVEHLASPEAGFTTGQVVGIHGGVVLARL